MAKLTDGSENECADNEINKKDEYFSDDGPNSSEDECKRDNKMRRSLAEGRNLNNSFNRFDASEWDHLHQDKGANPQFLVLQKQRN